MNSLLFIPIVLNNFLKIKILKILLFLLGFFLNRVSISHLDSDYEFFNDFEKIIGSYDNQYWHYTRDKNRRS